MRALTIRCWVDPFTQNNVVTLRGATREEADQIFSEIRERFADTLFHEGGQRTLWVEDTDVFIHHHHSSGGELELISHSLDHRQLLDLLPEEIRNRVEK